MKNLIIDKALENFKKETGINARWEYILNNEYDGMITFDIDGNEIWFYTIVKNEIRDYQLNSILDAIDFERCVIITQKLYPGIKKRLRTNNIPYIDIAGNAFLNKAGKYILIDGKKVDLVVNYRKEFGFTKAGMILIFKFLNNPDYINKPYREIAKENKLALGTINKVIEQLKKEKHLAQLTKEKRKIVNTKNLLNKWIEYYPGILKNKLLIGTYTFLNNDVRMKWKEIPLENNITTWGGEPAADILTGYLQPELFTLYTLERKDELMKKYKIIPNEEGEIKVYKKFWNIETNKAITPPLLTYADLMNTGNNRNIETAKMIYEEYINIK